MLYTVQKQFPDYTMDSLVGEFFDVGDCNILINESCNIVTSENKLLCSIEKGAIPSDVSRLAVEAFKKKAKSTTTNTRGMAAGKVDLAKVPGNIVELLEPGKFSSKVRYSNGNTSNHRVSNKTNSMIVGFYDKPKRGESFNGLNNTRPTAFCERYPDLWENYGIPFIEYIDYLYSDRFPDNYYYRKMQASTVPYGMIKQTIFTTATINYNFRTAAHVDSGNSNDYSVLTCHGDWSGGYLIYPQYRVAVNIQDGDLLIMNPHQHHCNSPIEGMKDRLSLVLYAREKIVNNQ